MTVASATTKSTDRRDLLTSACGWVTTKQRLNVLRQFVISESPAGTALTIAHGSGLLTPPRPLAIVVDDHRSDEIMREPICPSSSRAARTSGLAANGLADIPLQCVERHARASRAPIRRGGIVLRGKGHACLPCRRRSEHRLKIIDQR